MYGSDRSCLNLWCVQSGDKPSCLYPVIYKQKAITIGIQGGTIGTLELGTGQGRIKSGHKPSHLHPIIHQERTVPIRPGCYVSFQSWFHLTFAFAFTFTFTFTFTFAFAFTLALTLAFTLAFAFAFAAVSAH